MSLKFNDAIEIVAEKLLEAPDPDFQTYLEDTAEISEKIDQELIKINSIFKGTVTNWEESADLPNTKIPKLRIPGIRLKMPFMVEPQPVLGFSSAEIKKVNLKTSVNHPAVENGYLNGEKLTNLFIWDLNRVIEGISSVTCCSGKIYKLSTRFIELDGDQIINIYAKENDLENLPSIVYSFVLHFLFTNQYFGYIYLSNVFHQLELSATAADLKKKAKVVQIVTILIQNLIQEPKRPLLRMHPIYNIIKMGEFSFIFGSALLEAIPKCIPHLQNPEPLKIAFGKLMRFKQSDSVQLKELMKMFGLE